MPAPSKPKPKPKSKPAQEETPPSEGETGEVFGPLEEITRGLLRVPKEELAQHLAAKRTARRRVKK
ncbi:MAG: hypothetical protein QOF89_350 [Acidobacteriota bacterium]|jgi:hypothetical protein|nr:hypothetical protein [Acidobacteriota bacterium]